MESSPDNEGLTPSMEPNENGDLPVKIELKHADSDSNRELKHADSDSNRELKHADSDSTNSIAPPPPPPLVVPVASEESCDITEVERLKQDEDEVPLFDLGPEEPLCEKEQPVGQKIIVDGNDETCCRSVLKCLGLVPCPSLLSWIILLCGIGCLTGSLLIGTWRTRDLLKDDGLLWFMEYTIIGVTIGMFVIGTLLLTTGHLSTEPTSRRIFNSLTKNRCAQGLNFFALVVTYILTITWTLVSVVLATPLVLLINILIVGKDSVDPTIYGFQSEQITKAQFQEDGVNLLITYAIALFGSILIVNSMICFLISISANITHLRDNRFATFNTYSPGEEIHCSKHSVVDTNM